MKNKRLFNTFMIIAIVFFLIASASPLLAAGKGKYGGTLVMAAKETFTQFGVPWEIRGPADRAIQLGAQTLIQITDEIAVYEPRLATSWDIAADKSHFIFKLRKGVKFNDGTDFNAQAVKFNIEQVKKSKRPMYLNVTSVDVIDDYTIKVNLSSFNYTVFDEFGYATASIISPTACETKDAEWLATNPVGTGPFKIKNYKARTHMKWEKNKDYWDKGYPYLDEIHQLVINDPMTQEAMFLKGDLHVMSEVDTVTAENMIQKGFRTAPLVTGGQMMLYFNTADPNSVWSNQKLREALEYAIDKEKIVKTIGKGYARASYECLWGASKYVDPKTTPRKYDPEKAKQLLKEAGYPNGVKAELISMIKFYTDMFVAIQGYGKAVGFDLKLTRLDPAAWNELRFDTAPVGKALQDRQRGGGVNILRDVKEDLSSKGLFYKGMVRPEGFENALDMALNANSLDISIAQLEKMEEIAYNNAMFVPLWIVYDTHMLRPELKWDESERKNPFNVGGTPVPRNEYIFLDK